MELFHNPAAFIDGISNIYNNTIYLFVILRFLESYWAYYFTQIIKYPFSVVKHFITQHANVFSAETFYIEKII